MGQKYNKSLEFIKGDVWIIMLDILAVNAAYFLALIIRLSIQPNFYKSIDFYRADFFTFAPFYTVFCIVVFFVFRLYSGMWRYASFSELMRAALGSITSSILHTVLITVLFRRMPLSYYLVGAGLQGIFLIGIRFSYRFVQIIKKRNEPVEGKRVMLIGAGSSGQMILRDMYRAQEVKDKAVCIIKRLEND